MANGGSRERAQALKGRCQSGISQYGGCKKPERGCVSALVAGLERQNQWGAGEGGSKEERWQIANRVARAKWNLQGAV